MTQEEKQLLLRDISARLPYGVKVRINKKKGYYNAIVCEITRQYICVEGGGELYFSHGTYKPYHRPMSSMTEEERGEFRMLGGVMSYSPQHNTWAISAFSPEAYDWLNKKMFDYRGLIEKGLANEAPEGMYGENC